MAEIHTGATLVPGKLELLTPWLPRQRWYAGKSASGAPVVPVLRHVGGYRLDDPAGEVGLEVIVAVDTSGAQPVTYQIPLSYRGEPEPSLAHALVGTTEHSVLGTRWVYDGCHDPVFATALVNLLSGRTRAQQRRRSHTEDPSVTAHTLGPADQVHLASHAVLTGEQSNTSLVCRLQDSAGGPLAPIMLKVFRVLSPGENPDVVLASALSEAGSPHVPLVFGFVTAHWDLDPTSDGEHESVYHLAFAQELLDGVEDAWRVAVRAASAGEPFGDQSHALGRATAQIHAALAARLGSEPASDAERTRVVAELRARATHALAQVPALSDLSHAVGTTLDALESLPASAWPPLQRVHGDYHLGQVLHSGNGWAVIDFEGEPLRPLAERARPDLALRDVAGMLRSFDYAGGTAERAGTEPALARAWVARAQERFLAGYREAGGDDSPEPAGALLDALLLDKALYEALYEARNRPTWLPIPVTALRRLLTQGQNETGHEAVPFHEDGATMTTPAPIDHAVLGPVARGEHALPHDSLGAHLDGGVVTLRTRRPLADAVTFVIADDAGDAGDASTPTRVPARHEVDGIWVAALEADQVPDYRVEVVYDGYASTVDDPYRFLPTLGEVDLHLIGEGRHEKLWDVLGSHLRTYPSVLGDVHGASFAVWAPNAQAVRVVGDFNGWDGPSCAMRSLGGSGVWELFVPGVEIGARYKYEIQYRDGSWHEKADPMARACEVPPLTASVVTSSSYTWEDSEWLERRAASDPHNSPMSIYELHLGSWKQGLSYRAAADELVEYLTWLGYTHVEFMPLAEHPFGGSWGYQVTSYFAPSSRYGVPDDLRYLVDRLHQAGIGVIMDWVPAHFPKDAWALANFDGTALYEHPDPRRGEQKDWGTYVFNFGRTEVRNFLVANAAYWLEEFHIDGLRVDAVASMLYLDYSRNHGEWEPNVYGGRENLEAISLLQETNAVAYRVAPGSVMVAEESTSFPGVTTPTNAGGLGFGLKWNMGWMNDTLRYAEEDPVNRRYHHNELTFSLVYAFSEQFLLPLSHDEVVHGKGSLLAKMPGDHRTKLAGVRGLLSYQWSHPGKILLFMGQEFAQAAEWSEDRSLDWWQLDDPGHRGVAELVRRMNTVYREHPALWAKDNVPAGFEWLDSNDADGNLIAYLRTDTEGDTVVCIQSFSGMTHESYRVPLPFGGRWTELLSTDAEEYGGYGVGNLGVVTARDEPHYGRSHSAVIRVPALGAIWLTPEQTAQTAGAAEPTAAAEPEQPEA